MPNMKPISDLLNYSEVLCEVAVDAPVFLTKNGRGLCRDSAFFGRGHGRQLPFVWARGKDVYIDRVLYGHRAYMRILFGDAQADEADE